MRRFGIKVQRGFVAAAFFKFIYSPRRRTRCCCDVHGGALVVRSVVDESALLLLMVLLCGVFVRCVFVRCVFVCHFQFSGLMEKFHSCEGFINGAADRRGVHFTSSPPFPGIGQILLVCDRTCAC